MKDESRRRLQEFVDRATYLEKLSYFENGASTVSMTFSRGGEGNWIMKSRQPSDEQRDALLLTLRLFLQDKDKISLKSMTDLYSDPAVSRAWKLEHAQMRGWLDERLHSAATMKNGKVSHLHRDVLRVVLWGKLAHYKPNHPDSKLYEEWTKDETATKLLHLQFHKIVIWVTAAVINVCRASQEELVRDAAISRSS